MKKNILATLSFALVCGLPIGARTWTLQECIDYAMANNISIAQKKLKAMQSVEDVAQSRSALFPSVSFSTNQNMSYRPFSESTFNLTNGSMTSNSNKVSYNGSYGINANWTVWNGNRNRLAIASNKISSEMSACDVLAQQNSVQEQIAQLYVQCLYEEEAVRVNEEIVKASILQRDRAKEMVEVGSLAKVDLAQLEAQVTQDQYSLISSQAQLANFRLQLKQLLEIHDDEEFCVVDPSVSDESIMEAIPSKESIYGAAVSSRPEIISGKLGVNASEIALKSARTGYMPTLNLTAGIGTNNSSGQSKTFASQVRTNLSNSLGLTLSIPIFDNLQTRTNIRKAKLSLSDSQYALQSQEKSLYSTVEKYWLDATSSQQQYLAAKKNEESMKVSYELVSEQFACGLKNIVELTTGKNNLLQAEQQLLQTKYTALLNQALLRFYSGEPMNF